jgi:hypothetical protein
MHQYVARSTVQPKLSVAKYSKLLVKSVVLLHDLASISLLTFMLEGICAEADASALSDTDPGTHSIGISGPGKPPFEVGHQIPVRAFERGELPA